MGKILTADDIAKQIDVLQNQLFNAKAHFEIYMGLAKSWDEHILEIQNSPVFWQFTMKAHIDASVVYLCRVYDSHRAALQLSTFLENVEKNIGLFCESEFRKRHAAGSNVDYLAKYPRTVRANDLTFDMDFCSKNNPLVRTLHRWRHNLVAHFNYEEAVLSKTPMHKRHPLPFKHIKTLIDRGLDILNHYSGLLDAKEYSTQFASRQGSDYTDVLKWLRFARIGRRWNQRRIRKMLRRKIAEDTPLKA
jgi:hypothetical protein